MTRYCKCPGCGMINSVPGRRLETLEPLEPLQPGTGAAGWRLAAGVMGNGRG